MSKLIVELNESVPAEDASTLVGSLVEDSPALEDSVMRDDSISLDDV